MKIGAASITAVADPAVESWLQAELERLWLLAELCLRYFQRAQLRPQPEHPSLLELESIFASRHQLRGRGARPGVEALEEALERSEGDGALAALREGAPIGRLRRSLGLRAQELEVLLVSLAPHIDAPLAEVFQVLRGSPARRGVDLALITQLYRLKRVQRVALLDVVNPERPLLKWQLIQILPPDAPEAYGSVFYRAVQPTLDLLSALKGGAELSPVLARCARLCSAAPDIDDLRLDPAVRERLARLCAAARVTSERPPQSEPLRLPTLVLWGGRGAGKRELAARVAAFAGRALLSVDLSVLEPSALDAVLRHAQREALIHGAALYLGPIPRALLAEEEGRALTRRFDSYPAPLMLGVEAAVAPRLRVCGPVEEVEVPLPAEGTRAELWELAVPQALRDRALDLPGLARAFRLSPGEIRETAAEAVAMASLRAGGAVTHAQLRCGIDRRLRNELGDLARRIRVTATWDDLVLPPEDLFRVREFVGRALYAQRVYHEWGFGPRVGYGKGMIALFSGPPGTGKTMLAGLIGEALDLDVYQVDLSQVTSRWVGETEKQLARVFDQAERAHAVLLFDEADALFAKRTEVTSANDRYGNLAVNYLLQRLEQYSGVAVLTTNKVLSLDEALQRRLSLHLRLEIPEAPERERLWRSMLPAAAPLLADIDLAALAKEFELAGGYIKNVAVRAAFLAAADDAPIRMDLLRRAAVLELEDLGRLIANRDFDGEKQDGAEPHLGWEPAGRPFAPWVGAD